MKLITGLVFFLQVAYCAGQFDQFVYSPALIYEGESEKVTFKERKRKELIEPVVCQSFDRNSSLWLPLPTLQLDGYTIQCLVQAKHNNGSLDVRLWQGNKGVVTDAQLKVISRPILQYFGPKRVSAIDQFVLKAVLQKDDLLKFLPLNQYVPTLHLHGQNLTEFILTGQLFPQTGEIIFVYSNNAKMLMGFYTIKLYLDMNMQHEIGFSDIEPTFQIVQPTVRLKSPYFDYNNEHDEVQIQLELNVPRLADVKAIVQVQNVKKQFVWEASMSGLGTVNFENVIFNASHEPVFISDVSGAISDRIASSGQIVQDGQYDIPVYRIESFKDIYRGEKIASIQAMPSFQSALPSEVIYKISSKQNIIPGWFLTQLRGQLHGINLELDLETNWTSVQLQDRTSLDIQLQQGWNSRIDPQHDSARVEILGVEAGNCPPGFYFRDTQQASTQKQQLAEVQKKYPSENFFVYIEARINKQLYKIDIDIPQQPNVSVMDKFRFTIPFGVDDLYVVLRSSTAKQPASWMGCLDPKALATVLQINATVVEWRHKIDNIAFNSSCSVVLIFEDQMLLNQKHSSYKIPNRMLSLPTRRKSIEIDLFQQTDPLHMQLKSLSLVNSDKKQTLLCGNNKSAENEWYVGKCNPQVSFSVVNTRVDVVAEPLFPLLAEVKLDRKFSSNNTQPLLPVEVTAKDGMGKSTYEIYFLQENDKFQERLTSVDELCIPCRPGSFSSVQNAQYCLLCGAGSFSDKTGSASCELCPIGTYAQQLGSVECNQCLQGTFASSNGSSICEVCEEGSVTFYEGSATCMDREKYLAQLSKDYKVVVSFALWLNGTSWEDIDAKTINLGVNASSNTILSLLLQADTARLFNISFQDVQVMELLEVQTRSLSENSTMIRANITATLHQECDGKKGKQSFDECVELMHSDADHALYELSGGGAMRQIDSVLDVETEFDEDEYYVEEHPATHRKMPALEVILLPTISGTIMAVAALGVWIRLKQKQVSLCGWRSQPRYKRQV
eukprot:TRINITY_DN4295_c0_g1_i2.p1 TRINITY_DN4295_c0_g1~~TRINITY_DN4295_c0_g1_i2.p1  ORF type:complete len:1008 (-),score=123.57 TRINITY_DN4295_c0_g1_i2:305-3328(-)